MALPKQSTKTEVNELNEETNASLMATCINTGLKLTFVIKTSKHGSNNLEDFLIAVKKHFLKESCKRRCFEHQNNKISEIYEFLNRLKNLDVSMFRKTKQITQE